MRGPVIEVQVLLQQVIREDQFFHVGISTNKPNNREHTICMQQVYWRRYESRRSSKPKLH